MKKFLITIVLILCVLTIKAQDEKLNRIQLLSAYQTNVYLKPYYRNLNIYSGGFGYKGNLIAINTKINVGYLNTEVNGVLAETHNKKQLEIDYWQTLNQNKLTSFWLNYAYSQDELFPNHRVIFEVWQKLPANFLISGGGSYYKFTDNDARIINIGIENYFNRYWVEFKTYFSSKKPDIRTSHYLNSRVFFNDVNYLQLTIGFGSAEDEPVFLETELGRLNAYTAKIRYATRTLANERIELRVGVGYIYEEYVPNIWRNKFDLSIGLNYNIRK